ncbi:MAG: dihydrolipoyl dehydrogenase [Elusimicrobiota bacterium]
MANNTYNLIVIGAGPAGYSAAIRGAQLGALVLLVEKEAVGGTCLNWGCMPTKFLWESLHLQKKMRRAADYGITADVKGQDFTALQQKKGKTVELLTKGLSALLKSYSIETAEGAASFAGPDEIIIKKKNGETQSVKGKKIIIATGSRSSNLKDLAIDHNKILDSTDLLNIKEPPKSLLIIGGGAIGVELATIYSGLGCEVTVIEKEPQLLPAADAELAAEVKKILERQGVKVITGSGDFGELVKTADKVLLSAGRKPNVDGLALEKAGVKYSEKGIEIDEFCRTSDENIYAAGDVTGKSFLAYVSQAEGAAAAENALGGKTTVNRDAVPWAVFSDPPVAGVGARENDLPAEKISIGRFQLAASGRAAIESERKGWAKIICEKSTGKLLGGCMAGPGAEELMPVLALAVRNKLTAKDLSREIFFHPSISEALHCACEDALGKCVDLPAKK